MKRHLAALACFALAMALVSSIAGCGTREGGGDNAGGTNLATSSGSQGVSSETSTGQLGPDGKPVKTLADFPDAQDGAKVEGVIKTDKGDIVIQFFSDSAPVTVASFIHLARSGFYNGTRFHRVEKTPVPFVIQGGDPKSRDPNAADVGTGGPGYYIPAEFNNRPHLAGTVSMARSQSPNSGGSQFFICLSDCPELNGQYTAFGQVASGMDVVNSIEKNDVIKEVVIRPINGH